MTTMTQQPVQITGGVGTHADTHTAAAVASAGRVLGSAIFPATGAGWAALLAWLASFGTLVLVGIEGTGVYGAGLARYVRVQGVAMVEIDRPDRKARRWQGKSDPLDAEAAVRAALAQVGTGVPKHRDGRVEALRDLRIARRSARCSRAPAAMTRAEVAGTAPTGRRGGWVSCALISRRAAPMGRGSQPPDLTADSLRR